jgi:hypothetical protein
VVKQENQNSEGLTSKPNPDAALEQFPGAGIHFERPECHASGSLGLMGHGGLGLNKFTTARSGGMTSADPLWFQWLSR